MILDASNAMQDKGFHFVSFLQPNSFLTAQRVQNTLMHCN